MLEIIAIRHGITEWNQLKRIQGHTDIPLSDEGITILQQYRVPENWLQLAWFSSPLIRAQHTAELLKLDCRIAPGLIEMHWGDWEGKTLTELRNQDAQAFADTEAKGLDMLPPQGESPRMVQERMTAWANTIAAQKDTQTTIGIVAHKGVIRAVLAAACDWDMMGKPPVKLDYKAAHRFGFEPDGNNWRLLEANIRLLPE
ncbi:MAG: Phosphoglycerate mutase family protein [uncultured Thiotrichaceae bacterium]|uniref:Phosphoglycerate mutase family protein n=1 Tax=uncultured Thiotrichaceae bacterium TaxID=298394 RepID=A0A6S6TDL2_9GAMM|nr:MAG: Phosphoglycerate mutase family protein [uncultured Thiotrichaceae bacterium]